MSIVSPRAVEQDRSIAKVARDHRLGLALILVGVLIMAAVELLGFFHPGFSGTGFEWFVLSVVGSAGFALIFGGAVFFGAGGPARRQRQRVA